VLNTASRRFTILVVLLILLASAGSLLALIQVRRLESQLRTVVEGNFASLRAALQLENGLLEQRGIAALVVIEGGGSSRIPELEWRRPWWKRWYENAKTQAVTNQERAILAKLKIAYERYDDAQERALGLIRAGDLEAAGLLLSTQVDRLGLDAHSLCEQLVLANEQRASATLADARARVFGTTLFVFVCMMLALTAGLTALLILLRRVLRPLERLAADAARAAPGAALPNRNEVDAVARSLDALAREAAEARTSLADGRELLVRSQKLAACVAHEVRSPLQAMSLGLYSLRRSVAHDPVLLERCQLFGEELERLDGMVRHFVEFARPPELRLQPVDVHQLVARTVELLRDRFDERKISVTVGNGIPLPRVMADAEQLKQVFLNLLSNAIHAMPEGGRLQIEERSETSGDRRPSVLIHVRDGGGGIPESVVSRLFEPFVTTRAEGTGLGLSIASNIVTRHGGRLVMETTGPTGTTFSVRIPAAAD